MIVYQDTQHGSRIGPPVWLAGAPNLCAREHRDGRLWGIGSPMLLGPPPDGVWQDIGNGYRVWLAEVTPAELYRKCGWIDCIPVKSALGVIWMAPQILTPMGALAYRPALGGPDFLPMPTPEQKRAQDVAAAARDALIRAREGEAIPLAAACQWASVLLALASFVPPELFRCGLMDETLAMQTCLAAAGVYGAD